MKVVITEFPGGTIRHPVVRAQQRKHRFCVYLGIRDNTVFVEPTILEKTGRWLSNKKSDSRKLLASVIPPLPPINAITVDDF